jgi:hypothetical protein
MARIPIETLGKILAGEERDRYVKVMSDKEHTDGFLILTGESRDLKNGYDNWVENEAGLEKYFRESNWLVEWLDS